MLLGSRSESFKSTLKNPLGSNVDPAPSSHLAIHCQSQSLESAKLVPVGPVPNEIGVSDEHSGRLVVSSENSHWLARLHTESLIIFEGFQTAD